MSDFCNATISIFSTMFGWVGDLLSWIGELPVINLIAPSISAGLSATFSWIG